ncbi:hypothetical protein Tco_1160803, partial [Tanacetum coccineum]
GHVNVVLHSVATTLGSSIGGNCIAASAPTHSYTSNDCYIHSSCTPCPTSTLNNKDQELHLFGPEWPPSNKGTTPSNIHIVQEPDAMVTTPADTICPPQRTICKCFMITYAAHTSLSIPLTFS